MAFNNTRTILLHGPRGMEWYVPTPARPPHETDKRHPMEIFRDAQFWAKPFPPTQPTVLGELATPGWEKRWSWTYVEATNTSNGMTRHFLRRNPDGVLLLREHLIGHREVALRVQLGRDASDEGLVLFGGHRSGSLNTVLCRR